MNSKNPALHSSLPRTPRRLLLSLSLVALCAVAALGQSAADGSTPPGLAPGAPAGSYSLSGFDNVNFYNGHLNFRLPLVRVGGRGSAGYTMTLKLEQKWLVQHWYDQQTNTHYYWPDPNWWSGMEVGLGAGTVQARPGGAGSYVCANEPSMGPRFTHTLTRLTATMPDGTEYEFVDKETRGKPNYAEAAGAPYYCTGASFNRKKEFVTTDGSAATFVSDQDIYDHIYADGLNGPQPVSGYLYLRDGTRYTVSNGAVTEIRDRNGNRVMVSDTGATDSLGRQTAIQYATTDQNHPEYGTGTRVSFAGFGGVERSIFITQTNLGSALKQGEMLSSPRGLFDNLGSDNTNFDPAGVVSAVWLPDGKSYKFFYNKYGELARVVLPTGGAIEYDYAGGISDGPASGRVQVGYLDGGQDNYQVYRRVVERRVYRDSSDTTPESTMTVSRPESYGATYYNNAINTAGYVETTHRAGGATGTILSGGRHYYDGSAARSMDTRPGGFSSWKEGRETKTEARDTDGTALTSVLRMVEHTWQQRAGVSWWSWWGTQFTGVDASGEPPNDPRLVTTVTTVEPSGANLVTKQTAISPVDGSVGFDQFDNQTDSWEYDFGAGSPGAFVRRAHTDFVTAAGYVNSPSDATPGAHLRGLPSRQWVSSDISGSNKVTLTDYGYDQTALTARSGITGHDPSFTTGYTTRGNATGVTRYANAASETGAVTTAAAYDLAGNVVGSTDARGKTSLVGYSDSFCNGSACGGSYTPNTYAFPTSASSPVPDPSGQYGSASALATSTVYDFWTGLAYSTTDANNKTTLFEYEDQPNDLDRVKAVVRPDGGRTDFHYGDAPGNLYVRTLSDLDTARKTESKQFFDGLGRAYRSAQYENYDTSEPWVTVDTEFDALGRARRTSMPYRAAEGAALFSTDKWAETSYDALGRVRAVKTKPDNAVVTTSYSGDRVLVKDQDGRERVSRADALGRLADVWEVRPSDADTVSIASFPGHPEAAHGYRTSYLYDVTGNLRRVTQGSQQRFFMYDSLGRLTRAKNPEQSANASITVTDPVTGNSQWSLAYAFDANGNIQEKTDARGTTATYVYDALNRNVTVSYAPAGGTAATPAVTRHYDNPAQGANGRGRLWKSEAAQTAQTAFAEYDAAGRPTGYQQKFWVNGAWGQAYTIQQGYNMAGGVTSQTYPSGHAVGYRYDITGRPADNVTANGTEPAFEGNLGDGAQRTYASAVVYDELGGMNQERFGTDTPLYSKRLYNGRGQLAEMRLSTYAYTDLQNKTDWNRGAVINHYSNAAGAWGATGGGPDDNGNLKRQEVYVPDAQGGTSLNLVQHYSYDDLNRLTSVEEKLGNATTQFVQAYRYDRWGNRTIKDDVTFNAPEPQFSVSTATNRLGVPTGQTGQMNYDEAGNLVNDSYSAYGSLDGTPTRSYDAEGRMTSAALNQYQSAVYAYDADGRRVKRNVGTAGEVWQVYAMGGELLAEYAPDASPTSPRKEYGYRGGGLLVVGTAALTAAAPSGLSVTSASNSPVSLSWSSAGAANYRVERGARVQGEIAYDLAGASQGVSFNDTGVPPGAAYLYRVCAADASGNCVSSFSNAALGTAYTFSDDPLVTRADHEQGLNLSLPLTVIKAQHVTQLREAVNAVRRLAGLTDATWAEASLSGVPVKASHVVEMRDRLGEALSTLGMPAPSYTDPALATGAGGTTIKRAHFAELRLGATKGAASGSAGSSSAGGVEWLVSDHLGTPRMVVDKTGTLAGVTRHDYFPFGEGLFAGVGGRTTNQGYSQPDGVRQKFTGKERDNETGLDYFEARYYANAQGRFTGVDPYNIIFRKDKGRDVQERQKLLESYISQPQVWNRYAYTLNSPCNNVDVGGRCSAPAGLKVGNSGICIEAFIASKWVGAGGRGDDRTHSGTDPSLTARIRVEGTFTWEGPALRFEGTVTAESSGVLLKGMGPMGYAEVNISNEKRNDDGSMTFTMDIKGQNGLGRGTTVNTIDVHLNITVTPNNEVGLAPGGRRDGYPSVGVYSYKIVAQQFLVTHDLYEGGEGNIRDLDSDLEVEIPARPPEE